MATSIVLWFTAAALHAQPVLILPRADSPASPGQQLQDAVNDPANAGTEIDLRPGTYLLDPSKPNGGRLVLQQGMTIRGANRYVDCDGDGVWDAVAACSPGPIDPDVFALEGSETLIDGTHITAQASGNAAVVRMGDENTVSGVTIRAPRSPTVGGSIDVNVQRAGVISAVVRDSILEGGQRGVRCNNGAPAVSGLDASALVERNVIRDAQGAPGTPVGFGVQVQNGGATGSAWAVTLRSNRIYGSRFGLFVVANSSRLAETRILSFGNLIHDNELGAFIVGGFAPAPGTPGDSASDNVISLDSHGDAFENNVSPIEHLPAFMGTGGGLVVLAAGRDTPVAGACSRNQVRLHLQKTLFRNNLQVDTPRHMTVVGSLSSPAAGPETGVGNEVRLTIQQPAADAPDGAFLVDDSAPNGDGSNQVRVLNSDVPFQRTDL
jgi:hypothetical protein